LFVTGSSPLHVLVLAAREEATEEILCVLWQEAYYRAEDVLY